MTIVVNRSALLFALSCIEVMQWVGIKELCEAVEEMEGDEVIVMLTEANDLTRNLEKFKEDVGK